MNQHPASRTAALVIALGIASALAPVHATDSACKPVFDAQMKQITVPYRISNELNGKPERDRIYTNRAMYAQMRGRWLSMPMPTQDRLAATRESGAALSNCKMLRTEGIDGEATRVYATHVHTTSPPQDIDSQIWISSTTGLPMKLVSDHHHSHVTERITYKTVQAPTAAR